MFSEKIYKITNITMTIMILILSLFVMVYTIFYPKITLKGSTTVTLNYKEKYNCGLREAKDAVDDIAAKHITDLTSASASGSGCSIILLIGISITLGAFFML